MRMLCCSASMLIASIVMLSQMQACAPASDSGSGNDEGEDPTEGENEGENEGNEGEVDGGTDGAIEGTDEGAEDGPTHGVVDAMIDCGAGPVPVLCETFATAVGGLESRAAREHNFGDWGIVCSPNNVTVGPTINFVFKTTVVAGELVLDNTNYVDGVCDDVAFTHITIQQPGSGSITLDAVEPDEAGGGRIAGSFADEEGLLSGTFDVTMTRP